MIALKRAEFKDFHCIFLFENGSKGKSYDCSKSLTFSCSDETLVGKVVHTSLYPPVCPNDELLRPIYGVNKSLHIMNFPLEERSRPLD